MDILEYSAVALSAVIREGKFTATEAMEAVLARIDEKEKDINAYVTIDREQALGAAASAQEKIEKGELTGSLAGVPVAIKDNMCTEGMLTTCSSKILENFVPTFSAEAVLNLEKAGAVIIGKTNMDEFAMGSTTETSAQSMFRAVPRAVPQRQWRRGNVSLRLAPTQAVPSGSRHPSAAWWD